jgi:hypothetical protein
MPINRILVSTVSTGACWFRVALFAVLALWLGVWLGSAP